MTLWHILAVPTVGAVPAASVDLATGPARRARNTSVMIDDLIEHGLDSPVGRQMNRQHRGAGVTAEDHRIALATLAVIPVRWLDRYGRRPAKPEERAAAALFYGVRRRPPYPTKPACCHRRDGASGTGP